MIAPDDRDQVPYAYEGKSWGVQNSLLQMAQVEAWIMVLLIFVMVTHKGNLLIFFELHLLI